MFTEDGMITAILNPNAKGVNPKVISEIREIISPDHLFLSRSLEDNEAIVRRLVQTGSRTIFTGGGDGTVVAFINAVLKAGRDLGLPSSDLPSVGVLRLGTGNALAEMVSSGDYLCDLRSFVQNPHTDCYHLPMIECEDRWFPFAGLGFDAELLNDYSWVKDNSSNAALSKVFNNVGGYFAAFFSRTLPRRVKQKALREKTDIRVVVGEGEAIFLGPDGEHLKKLGPGELVYEGEFSTVMAGTCPYYGYGMKVLPFASVSEDYMHFRIVLMPVEKMLANLRPIWEGRYRGDDIAEFLANDVCLEFSRPTPYQEAGDAMGHREALRFRLAGAYVDLVRFI